MTDDDSRVELFTWSGCPSYERALERMSSVLRELGHSDEQIAVRWVETDELAQAVQFVGSPTFRIDGTDIVDPGADGYGVTCRVYHSPDGRLSPLPTREVMRARVEELLGG